MGSWLIALPAALPPVSRSVLCCRQIETMSPFPRQLRWFTVAVFAVAVGAALFLARREGLPSLGALVVLGALVLLSAQMLVRLRDGVLLSPGLGVCMAAIVVFRDEHSLLGAMVVCSLLAVRPSYFSKASWGWLPFNAGLSALSFLIIWFRATYPRLREDQLQRFSWLFLIPLTLLQILVVGVIKVAESR